MAIPDGLVRKYGSDEKYIALSEEEREKVCLAERHMQAINEMPLLQRLKYSRYVRSFERFCV